jgi:hypothetical protein
LDGRNRAEACERAGVEPTTVTYDGDPVLFSLSKNKHRPPSTCVDFGRSGTAAWRREEGVPRCL